MTWREEPPEAPGAPYAQPGPRALYIHEDLSALVDRRFGPGSEAHALTRSLLEKFRSTADRIVVLTEAEQVERVVAQGPHRPFELALGIGRAGERVAEALHARTAWFPRVRRLGLTREEDGRGGYRVVSSVPASLAEQLQGVQTCASLAIVDDTLFSGLTMRCVLEALPRELLARTRGFCLRGVLESVPSVAALCPVTVGVAAPGRILEDVSFLNASGLVVRGAIRRAGQPPLAFFERPEWLRAWFPGQDGEVLDLCRRLSAMLEGGR